MAVISSGRHVTAYDTRVHVRESVLSLTLSGDMWRGRGEAKLPRPTATRRIFHYALQRADNCDVHRSCSVQIQPACWS